MFGKCVLLLNLVVTIHGQMEGFVVGGSNASIHKYPHSAFLAVACKKTTNGQQEVVTWICGSSIINQRILLTAGHCVADCFDGTKIMIRFGNADKDKGTLRSAAGFVLHDKYDSETNAYDIALIKTLLNINFGANVARVALMRMPPYNEPARLAGWGLIDEYSKTHTKRLKQVDQKVWTNKECLKIFGTFPKGAICATAANPHDFAAQGDSGSSLVVRGFIQIGLVSYKVPIIAPNVIVYTDVGIFYNWIKYNAHLLYCSNSQDFKLN